MFHNINQSGKIFMFVIPEGVILYPGNEKSI